MKLKLLLIMFSILTVSVGNSQNSLWNLTSSERTESLEKFEKASMPFSYLLYELNLTALKNTLANAPKDFSGLTSNVVVSFPNHLGQFDNYTIYEAPIMEEGLASRFSDIKSYVGKGTIDPTSTIRFSVTLFGLHVMSTSGEAGTFYIDTYTKDLSTYIVYNKKSLINPRPFTCYNGEEIEEIAGRGINSNNESTSTLINDGKFRQYRLAMACTIEYAAYHVNAAGLSAGTTAQKKAAVLAAMNVTMTRVNGIYERDMSLRMNLVANNDLVIFIDSDNFSNTNAGALINESQSELNSIIGFSNYDIGHTVSTGGGGLAGLGVVCTSSKGRGITGSPAPVGDAYDVDYVAHEMGHQFGANHTFSGTGGSCTGNGTNSTAVEPGSGSTIMAYAGICTSNVQANSDPYFHKVSLDQINAHVLGTGNCAAITNNGNFAPVVSVTTSSYTIPNGTPFVLTATATDANNDALTYCWEQTNNASGTNMPTSTQTSGPVFRSYNPVSSPSRYFPAMSTILSGATSNSWEAVPTVARSLSFYCTVRDNRTPNGGQTNGVSSTVTVGSTGPFNVTSQSTPTNWTIGSTQTVTWDVNGTNALAGASNVDVLLSTDGGLTFPIVLVSNVLNDGSQDVVTPSVASAACRVMVKPTGNIFFDVNAADITIGVTVTCETYSNNNLLSIPDGTGANVGGAVVSKTLTVPTPSNTITDVNVTLGVTHTYMNDLILAMNHPDNTQVILYNRACGNSNGTATLTFNDGSAAIPTACAGITGTYAPAAPLSAYNSKPTSGTWTLLGRDFYNGDVGSVSTWSIELCYQTAAAGVEGFGLANFGLYPNPNNGSFTIQFDADSSNDVVVNVHDMRGRQVYAASYKNSGFFNQNLQLNNILPGVYLVTVQNGSSKEVKKIVVE